MLTPYRRSRTLGRPQRSSDGFAAEVRTRWKWKHFVEIDRQLADEWAVYDTSVEFLVACYAGGGVGQSRGTEVVTGVREICGSQ